MTNINPGDLVEIEASTGNGQRTRGEWENHPIKGVYEFVREDETRIFLKEESVIFPVMKSKITKFKPT